MAMAMAIHMFLLAFLPGGYCSGFSAESTEVTLLDGTTKRLQDVTIGDKLKSLYEARSEVAESVVTDLGFNADLLAQGHILESLRQEDVPISSVRRMNIDPYDYDEEEEEIDYFEGEIGPLDVYGLPDNMTTFRTRSDFKGLLAYIKFALRFSGARRRYGTYENGQTDDTCTYSDFKVLTASCRRHVAGMLPEDIVMDGTRALKPVTLDRMKDCMGFSSDLTCCHECLACESEDCLVEVAGCGAFYEEAHKGCVVTTEYDKGFYEPELALSFAFDLKPLLSLMLTITLPVLIY